jgi:lysophospholipase L1-like esterase
VKFFALWFLLICACANAAVPGHFEFMESGKPFIFSEPAAEGNYRVTATLGNNATACSTTVKAESRRLMVERLDTLAGQFTPVTFIVNVRNSKVPAPPLNAPGGDQVRLNSREAGVLHWDDKLNLEFTGAHPCVASLDLAKADELPTVFLAGDSTVTDQPREPTTSWGQMLPRFFKPDIAVANHAESGETMKSFITGLRLDKILSQIKKGDYLLIQFGHNDMKQNWPQTYVEPFTTHKQYLKVMIAEARLRGAFPVLITPMQRHNFEGAKIRNTLGDFPESIRQTAKEENVPLIDLTAMSVAFYEAMGTEKSWLAFSRGTDATHHSAYGAYELAKCVAEGIRRAVPSLAAHLTSDFQPFDPAHPDAPGTLSAAFHFDFSNRSADGKPFYMAVPVPEGNYKVTATFGSPKHATVTTVKAELRRLMLEKVVTAPGQFETRTFLVNVRTPAIPDGSQVRLKPRETTSEAVAWDDRLNLAFTNEQPGIARLDIERAETVPTLFIAGDSTSTDQPGEPFNSWGQMLTRFLKPQIAVANHGESGESLRSFFAEKRFDKVMSLIRPGDYLMIQMGHNDQKDKTPGSGAFTSYKDFLKQMIAAARQKGATPILVTPMNRLTFDADGKITNSLGDFPAAVRQTAKEEGVALIDLHAMSQPFYEALGPVVAHQAFAGNDTTHHSDYGSYELAKCIVQTIKAGKLPLARYVVDDFSAFDPAHPDPAAAFAIPPDPVQKPADRPLGN